MRVLCCTAVSDYAVPDEAALKAVAEYAPGAEVVDVTGDSFGYWREIRARWQGTEDLMLIEHDVLIGEDTVASLRDCGYDWCCFAYPIFRNHQRLRYGLGCTKFSAVAQRAVSARLIAEGFALCKECHGMGCWYHLDGRISILMREAGFRPHVHGDVIHLHDYAAGPEDALRDELAARAPWRSGGELPDAPLIPQVWSPSGIPIERFDPDYDDTPAVTIADYWPRTDLYAVTPRQAAAIAADLGRLGDETRALSPGTPFHTDKITHGYLPVYSRIARHLGMAARVCEIGVFQGGGLDMFRALFPQGTIAGVDIHPDCTWPDGTIRIVADQADPALARILDRHEDAWDLIADDGCHDGRITMVTLCNLWKLVSPGGFYVIEDWFTGFPSFTGYDDSMNVLAKDLIDRLDPLWLPDPAAMTTDVESIEYRHGMIVMRKAV